MSRFHRPRKDGVPAIELLVRGVAFNGNRVLICRNRKKGHGYLPGGHLEWGESVTRALTREVREETGLACRAGRFLGAVEHTFVRRGRRTCEVNLLFELQWARRSAPRSVPAREKKLEFIWCPLDRLGRIGLQPAPLQRLLKKWSRSKKTTADWASTFPRTAK